MDKFCSSSSRTRDLPPDLAAEVHRLLAQRIRDIWLRGELLDLYRGQSWHRRSKQVRVWMYWVIAINFAMVSIYSLIIPDVVWLGVAVSVFIIPLFCICAALVWRKPRSSFAEGLSTTLSVVFTVAVIAVLGYMAGGYNQERFVTGAIFIVGTAVVLFSVDFAWTISVVVGTMAIVTASHLLNPLLSLQTVISVSAFYFAGLVALVVSRRTTTVLAMHAFLVSLRDRMNAKALAEANEQLQMLATRDPLTGIANRRMVTDHLAKLWSNPAGRLPVAAVMVDIDHFKGVNDTRGHAEGDIALRQVAGAICASIRPSLDLAARYGGEEFIVVMTDAPRPFAVSLAESIRCKIEALAIANPGAPGKACVTVRIGVAFAQDGESAEQVVQRADAALYQAKGKGRNNVVVSAPGDRQIAPGDRQIAFERTGSGTDADAAFEEPAIAAAN